MSRTFGSGSANNPHALRTNRSGTLARPYNKPGTTHNARIGRTHWSAPTTNQVLRTTPRAPLVPRLTIHRHPAGGFEKDRRRQTRGGVDHQHHQNLVAGGD